MSLKQNLTSKSSKLKVGITIGDPSGIGPVITLKAVQKLKGQADFVIIGDKWVLNKIPNFKNQISKIKLVDLKNVPRRNFSFGKLRAEYGRASIEYLDKALELIREKEIDCLVTCPVSKSAISLSGKRFVGHTEYLAGKSHTKDFVMMLLNNVFKFSLVTRHLPLNAVSYAVNQEAIYRTIVLTYRYMQKLFGISKPRIVVCGLNPHASDSGLIGIEEEAVIEPALRKLRKEFPGCINGPISSDVAVYRAKLKQYDCVIAMYHDQALIPLKLFSPAKSVNLTLGLPFIRTSPLHGTAFDIAKRFALIKPDSLIAAIKTAIKCTINLKKD